MEEEEQFAKRLADIRELGKEDKNIDVAGLAMAALAEADLNQTDPRRRKWAYLISVGAPPLGLLFAVWYAFSGKADGKRVALLCVIFTGLSLGIAVLLGSLVWSSLGSTMHTNGFETLNLNVDDIKSLYQ